MSEAETTISTAEASKPVTEPAKPQPEVIPPTTEKAAELANVAELVTAPVTATASTQGTETANVAELVGGSQTQTRPKATTADILPAAKGKGNRTLADYAKLDWSKTNSVLAKEAGVSRQRIAQIREELKGKTFDNTTQTLAEEEPSEINEASGVSDIQQPAEPAIAKATTDYKLLAETTFDMSVGLATMIIGPEWQPREMEINGLKINERNIVCDALQKYYTVKQVPDLPPGVILAFVVTSYAGARFQHDNTKTKFKGAWIKVKIKVFNVLQWFKRKKKGFIPAIIATESGQATTSTP